MTVGNSIGSAFVEALTRYPDIAQAWVQISHRIGGRLPHSSLVVSIQREGRLDTVLRCLEDECAVILATGDTPKDILIFNHLRMFSDYWMGSMYETFRLLRDRGLAEGDAFASILLELELVRMGIDKHEIRRDKKLAEPMSLVRMPRVRDDEEPYVYDPNDLVRAHIMPTGMSESGSASWHVIDHINDRSFWIDRRALSDRVLDLWKPSAP